MCAANVFRFRHPLRVRWAECDAQGIVFFARYYEYFDIGMTEYLRHLGVAYPQDFLGAGGDLFLKHSQCEYHRSARFDDCIEVATRVARLGRSSIVFDFRVEGDDQVLATGQLVYVFADPASRTSLTLPASFRATVNAFEPRSDQETEA